MKHKKILAALTAAAIGISLAGCGKFPNSKGPDVPPSDPPAESFTESEEPSATAENQVAGKVTSLEGTKLTIELGELKRASFDRNGGNGGNRDNSNRKERPSGSDGQNRQNRPSFYSFSSTGKTSTYDISGLKEIKLENDSDDTADTVDEIKTGDIVVIETGKDGEVTSLTVKDLNARGGNSGGRNGGKQNRNGNGSDRTGNNNRNNRSSRNNRSGDQNRDA